MFLFSGLVSPCLRKDSTAQLRELTLRAAQTKASAAKGTCKQLIQWVVRPRAEECRSKQPGNARHSHGQNLPALAPHNLQLPDMQPQLA